MKMGMGLSLPSLAILPGSGGSVIENIKPFLSSLEGKEGIEACNSEITTTYYKNNGEDPLSFGDKVYTDSAGTKPFIPGGQWLGYEISSGVYGYYGLNSLGVVQFLGACPLPITKFDSTVDPVGQGEACEEAYEGTSMYKNGSALLVTGDSVWKDAAGEFRASAGYYKAIFSGISYEYEIKSTLRVGDVTACE